MVSIIIPTYNYGHFIAETLQSVLKQGYSDWECIIVNNGSTDNTEEILQPFLIDKRFVYIQQQNMGVSHARNTALAKANGEYILFLDADDLIEEDKLKESVTYLTLHTDVDLVYGDMRYFKNGHPDKLYYRYSCDQTNDQPWMTYIQGSGEKVVDTILNGNIMVISSPLVRNMVYKECGVFNESLEANEDWDLWLRILSSGKNLKYLDLPNTKTLIRIHTNSLSKDVFKMQINGLQVLLSNAGNILKFPLEKKLKQRMNDHIKGICSSLLACEGNEFNKKVDQLKAMNLYRHVFLVSTNYVPLMRIYLKARIYLS